MHRAEVLRRAHEEERILITNDEDFGGKVYRARYPHSGIVLLRLENERSQNKIAVLRRLLRNMQIAFRIKLSSQPRSRYDSPAERADIAL